MSYRIWLRAFGVSFMATQTVSSEEEAEGIAGALAKAVPDSTVGVDRVERVSCRHRIGADVRKS